MSRTAVSLGDAINTSMSAGALLVLLRNTVDMIAETKDEPERHADRDRLNLLSEALMRAANALGVTNPLEGAGMEAFTAGALPYVRHVKCAADAALEEVVPAARTLGGPREARRLAGLVESLQELSHRIGRMDRVGA